MRLYVRALSYFRFDIRLIGLLLLAIVLSTGIGLLMAWPMAILIDSVLATPTRPDFIHTLFLSPLPHSRLGQMIGLAIVGLLLKFSQDLLSMVQTILSNKINYNGLMRVRCDLYRKLQALSLSYHRSQPQGDAIYRLSSDTFGCQTILGVIITTAVAVITLAVMSAVLATRNLNLTILALSIAPVLAFLNVTFARRLKQRSLECREVDAQFTTTVQRSMSCIGLVQAFGREADEFGRFQNTVNQTIQAWWRLNWQQMAYNLLVGTVFGVGGAIVFGYGGYLVYRDQFVNHAAGGMTVGDLVIFTSYLGMLWQPLCNLTGFSANLQGGAAGAQRVFEVLDLDPIIEDAPSAIALPLKPRALMLDRVSFGYDRSSLILRDVTATIEPGQIVAFVGSSGVGKSTLLNLLPRFYDPCDGAIRLDGIDAREVKVADLRKHVALVLQESVILPTTIAENIAYGFPAATRQRIELAAQMAGAASFVESLPNGYDTQISESGANLSGGQRQRIALARALLTEAPIVVLDEPTSALDPVHERLITEALRELRGQRTVIIVSHRLSTVVDCDQIFVMNNGQIVERGTHEQLLARQGLYFSIASAQLQLSAARAA
jgi:subfamily B ATP-binding cassette protein MsbA